MEVRLAAVGLLIAFGVHAQEAPPTFEVACIKPNHSGPGRGGIRTDPGLLSAANVTMKTLIRFAYSVREYQISGPEWIDSERYDVTAKSEESTTVEQRRQMLQTLLRDRFQLTEHRTAKELPVYLLVAHSNGAKLHKLGESDKALPSGVPGPGVSFIFQRSDLAGLAERLSMVLDRPVLDQTGIAGTFVFELKWDSPDDVQPDRSLDGPVAATLERDFGLTLKARKAAVEFLVLDRIEKLPTAN